ncbi:MAG TPA: sulfite exporter TauE/SafE family protein [Candidatus Methylomirabilis sp.]|nr:sulfite exporter TauE/SafE family protein [Candidatus Methylomirabilis sp.]
MILIVLLLGLGVGVLVGLLGIGGGVVLVPAMAYLLHMDQHLAQGTSLLILLPPVGIGALREYWRDGNVDLRAGILCALGFLVGGYLGGGIAVPLSSRQLKGLFGVFLILAAFLLWRKAQPEKAGATSADEERPSGR